MAAASMISNSLRNLSAFLQDHQVSFSNGLLILFTIGGEQIFRFNAFRCPCNHDEAFNYALIFMLAPALILGVIGVAVSNLTWRILHGCKQRSEKAANSFCKTSKYLFIATARASVVPFAWLFIALLDGNYYACMMAKKPCEKVSDGRIERDSEEILHLKSMSQNMAWIGLGALILASFIVICVVRCCDKVTYVQYKYLNSYTEAEQELMDKLIQVSTKELAENNVKDFIETEKLNKYDWDKISKVPDYTISERRDDASNRKGSEDEGDNKDNESKGDNEKSVTSEKTEDTIKKKESKDEREKLENDDEDDKKKSVVVVDSLTPLHEWVREKHQSQDSKRKAQDLEDNKRQEASQVTIQVEDVP